MAKEREAKKTGDFFKFTELGQVVAGTIRKYIPARSDDNTDVFVLDPAIIREHKDEKAKLYESCALGLSTDIAMKTEGNKDVGKIMSFQFVGTEQAAKGLKKIVRVLELSPDELAQLYGRVDTVGTPYVRPAAPDANDGVDEDELPL